MSRQFDSRASRFPKVTRGFPDAGCGLHRHRRGWLSDFGHEAAAVVAIGSVHLERRNHPTFEPHHLAVVRVARVPTDGEVVTLHAVGSIRVDAHACFGGVVRHDGASWFTGAG